MLTLAFTMCREGSDDYALESPVTVVTLYGPASYFEYRDTVMGYDYEIMQALAAEHGFEVTWVVADSLPQAVEMVQSGKATILASDVPENSPYSKQVRLCGPKNQIEQVLVQPPGDTVVVDLRQLAVVRCMWRKTPKAKSYLSGSTTSSSLASRFAQ